MSMEQLSFKLEVFEGPLELMLHLISKHKLNINDIEITLLLEQYLQYMDELNEADIDIAAEFLEMAARLIYIKTVSLLPVHEEADELRRELTGALIEYALCKKAAERMRERFIGFDLFTRSPMKLEMDNTYVLIHVPDVLLAAYIDCIGREQRKLPPSEAVFRPIVSSKIVSVTSKILYILRLMYKQASMGMDKLFEDLHDRSERVATFLAVLELSKSGRIIISDDNARIDFNPTRKQRDGEQNQTQ